MARKIQFAAELDASGFSRGLKIMEDSAAAVNGRMSKTLYQHRKAPVMTEAQVRVRAEYEAKQEYRAKEGARVQLERSAASQAAGSVATGGLSSIGAAQTMFISAARDSFASLASGQSPITVFLQQAPQVAQAFTMMRASGRAFLMSLLLNPITLTVAALAALGTAIFFVIRHFTELRKVQENLKNLMDITRSTFEERIKIQDEAVSSTREYMEWNKSLIKSENSVADALDKTLESMRAKAKYEQGVAESAGASKLQLQQMSLKAMQDEITVTKQSIDLAKKQFEDSKVMASFQRDKMDEFRGMGQGSALESGKRQLKEIEKVVSELEAKVRTEKIVTAGTFNPLTGLSTSEKERNANAQDKFKTTGFGDMSLEDAVTKYQEMNTQVRELENIQAKIASEEKDSKKTAEEKKKILDGLMEKQSGLESALENATKYPSVEKNKPSSVYSDALLATGNFLGAGQNMVGSIQQQALDEAKAQTVQLVQHGKSLATIAKNTSSSSSSKSIEVPD
jgi:hypothetical protein